MTSLRATAVGYEDSAGDWYCSPCGENFSDAEPLTVEDLARDPDATCDQCQRRLSDGCPS